MRNVTRRRFLGVASLGAAAGLSGPGLVRARALSAPRAGSVALIHGNDRGANLQEALTLIQDEVKNSIAGRTVLIKPNNVWPAPRAGSSGFDIHLPNVHPDALGAVVDWFRTFYKGEILIAESPALGAKAPALDGFKNLGYYERLKGYGNLRYVDLNTDTARMYHALDQNLRPIAVRAASLLTRKDIYLVSLALMKCHDRVIVTAGMKNICLGAMIVDGRSNDKAALHGGPFGLNYNIFSIGKEMLPHLSIIDGYTGMEGNGPVGGTHVDMRVALASTDCVACDRVTVELMGFPAEDIGYLTFAANMRLGEGNLTNIQIAGDSMAGLIKKFKPSDSIAWQLTWKKNCTLTYEDWKKSQL